MDDVRYIATHPLLQRIFVRCAELVEMASALADGSVERHEIEKRISRLEQYRLPKPTAADIWRMRPIKNEAGKVILPGGRSVRERLKDKRRGPPEQYRIAARAALEEKIRNPGLTWRLLAMKYGLQERNLDRQIQFLRKTLKHEGIRIPSARDCRKAENSFELAFAGFVKARRRDDGFFSPTTIPNRYRQGTLTPQMARPTGPGFSCQ